LAILTSRERVLATFDFREPDRVPTWLGASPEFLDKAILELNLNSEEELRQAFGDDFRRVVAPYLPEDPDSSDVTPFGISREGIGYGMAADNPLKNAGMAEIESYQGPDPDFIELSSIRKDASKHHGQYAILGGDWSPFWHDLTDLLGMENMFIKMYTDPELVTGILEKIMGYYMEVNKRIFDEAAGGWNCSC
jgi:uroporphyrinogen decarboxylase